MSISDRSSFQCSRSSTGGFLGPALCISTFGKSVSHAETGAKPQLVREQRLVLVSPGASRYKIST